ncbi:AAA family ATPase [Streptomyces sp. NEAU-YJ-81]|uniref:AAA family ATPase n=1 Tax=Streptomyces sp. NEAU-YJ-81 TaxID=2820288 RepID=UPI0027DEE89B|nr:AAA family ATPase [Streptomyces sp. NEAU-YJ-81]
MTHQPPIRIGVLGTHSTGKTTLLKRIQMQLRGRGLTVARTGRLAKRAAAIGLPKMRHHTAASTEWIITQGIADDIAAAAQGADVVLVDRASFDALAYYHAYYHAALEHRGEHSHRLERERLRLLASTQAPKYDLLLATVLDLTSNFSLDNAHCTGVRGRGTKWKGRPPSSTVSVP